jgi:prephenate dehydratase
MGPAGTFTHQAAIDLNGPGVEFVAEADAQAVIEGVVDGRYESGVVPFENSSEGEVGPTLDDLAARGGNPVISGERVLTVTFTLYRLPGDVTPLTSVSSHPFALAQCSRHIHARGLEAIPHASTAGACEALATARVPGRGAIGAPGAGEVYGLEAVERELENERGVETRFVKLARHCDEATVRDRSAFVIRPSADQPGGLVRILQQFSLRSINLTAITSRPARDRLGNYWFYIECEGHIASASIKDTVTSVLLDGGDITFLGSFPEDPSRPAARSSNDAATAYRRYNSMRSTATGHDESP